MDSTTWNDILEHCSFSWMKDSAEHVTPRGRDVFEGGAKTFINKGANQRWKGVLTDQDIQEYVELAEKELGKECAHWLVNGTSK